MELELVKAGTVVACYLEAPNNLSKLTFANVAYADDSKETLVISHLDHIGNRKLAWIERKQVVRVILNGKRNASHEQSRE